MDIQNYTTIEAMLRKRDVCQLLRISLGQVNVLMKAGVLKGVNLHTPGSKKNVWRFRAVDIRALIDKV